MKLKKKKQLMNFERTEFGRTTHPGLIFFLSRPFQLKRD
jgi:hypothetical protein